MLHYLLIITLILFAYRFGVLTWVSAKIQQGKILYGLIKKLQEKEIADSTEKETFRVNLRDDSATALYKRLNREYQFIVPYSRRHVASMGQLKAELIYDDKSCLDITQQPGIPYIFTAQELGGETIVITNQENQQQYNYGSDTRPMFALETMDEE